MKNLLILAACLFCIACNSSKQAQKHIDKAMKKNPETVANYTRQKFPCLTTTDTLTKSDTAFEFIEIQCPEIPNAPKPKKDTVYIKTPGQTKIIKSEGQTVIAPQVITKTVEIKIRVRDSADLFLLTKEKEKTAELKNKLEKKTGWLWWLLVLLGFSVFLNFYTLSNLKR